MTVELATDLHAVLASAGDSSATRTVYGVVIALGLIGVALVALAIWLIKQTKPEPELLAPLERMDDRAWRQQDPAQQRRDLDSLRPEGARPVVREKSVPDIDADFEQRRPALATFDDLQAHSAADSRRAVAAGAGDPLIAAHAARDDNDDDNDDDTDPDLDDDLDDVEAGGDADEVTDDGVSDDEDADVPVDHEVHDDESDSEPDTDGDLGGDGTPGEHSVDGPTIGDDDTGDLEVDEFGVRPPDSADS